VKHSWRMAPGGPHICAGVHGSFKHGLWRHVGDGALAAGTLKAAATVAGSLLPSFTTGSTFSGRAEAALFGAA